METSRVTEVVGVHDSSLEVIDAGVLSKVGHGEMTGRNDDMVEHLLFSLLRLEILTCYNKLIALALDMSNRGTVPDESVNIMFIRPP